ncbi:MAG: ATP-binding protein [Proteobacteria bacterium]|nr:ATP-binding protein [Pseudomonadota bacterium]
MEKKREIMTSTSSFEKMRDLGAIYIDKTALIYRMVIGANDAFFLARPRRFGKSLLISTLQAYFEGRRELFEGLAIADLEQKWEKYPVLSFDMSNMKDMGVERLEESLDLMLRQYEEIYGVEPSAKHPSTRLHALIQRARAQTGKRIVILIDEYDTPLLDNLTDEPTLHTLRNKLRDFYGVLKQKNGDLRFVFITGITRFSQLSIFSAMSNLVELSLDSKYASICGITKEELITSLKPELAAMAENLHISEATALARLKKKYDGYHFAKKSPDIFNPLSLLRALKNGELNNYWYATGTPTFLTKMIGNYTIRPEELDGFLASEMDFNVALEDAETPIPMLYQSGYVTIKKSDGFDYILGFPNEEVRVSFIKGLAPYYTKKNATENNSVIQRTMRAFRMHDVDTAMQMLRSFFSSIPYNAEKQDENHYKTIFYLIFTLATDYVVRTEQCSAAGRCDALIETEDTIYLFEFKLDGTAEDAIKQIDDKGYAIQYEAGDKKIVKIGANFESDKRTLERWIVVA